MVEIIVRNPVPKYRIQCHECKSVLQFIKSDMDGFGHIHCPACGMAIFVGNFSDRVEEENDAL